MLFRGEEGRQNMHLGTSESITGGTRVKTAAMLNGRQGCGSRGTILFGNGESNPV
jgi:hypothetical protein